MGNAIELNEVLLSRTASKIETSFSGSLEQLFLGIFILHKINIFLLMVGVPEILVPDASRMSNSYMIRPHRMV